MATIYRFPICFWRAEGSSGPVTARLVDDGYVKAVATAASKKDAVREIREYLDYLSREEEWSLCQPSFEDAELRVVKVSVLPEYVDGQRRHPCRESLRFRLPCVTACRAWGSPAACFPTLGIYFDYLQEDRFETLAAHLAQSQLAGKAPRELARYLPPGVFELETFSHTLRESGRRSLVGERTPRPLADVAEPLAGAGFRRNARVWEREREVDELAAMLREGASGVCLVGEPGCGKTAVLTAAARRLERVSEFDAEGETGPAGRRWRFWMTSAPRLVAGMRWLGQWQERLDEIVRQVSERSGFLCVESLAELTRLGGQTPESSLAAYLAPYVQSGELRLVCEATPAELEACDRALPGLVDRLRVLRLAPFGAAETRRVLRRAAEAHTRETGVEVPPSAAERVADLHARFLPYAGMPGAATRFLAGLIDRAANEAREQASGSVADAGGVRATAVGPAEIERAFAEQTGLPAAFVASAGGGSGRAGGFDHRALVAGLKERLVGQDEAVESASRVVAKFAAGLNDPRRPIGVLLFCGPTGVGKTQLVHLLGERLFPNRPEGERVLRLDMSEYAGPGALGRLLGSVHGEASPLVRRMRAQPFGILLLDEIEKAGEEVFDLFLGVFDEGRLTDALGRTTSFHSTLVVMTSNLGAASARALGFGGGGNGTEGAAEGGGVDLSAVKAAFRPEFFNRIDRVVSFRPLGREAIRRIARLELQAVAEREGLAGRGWRLEFDEALVERVAARGFDPVYGARPLQREVEESVVVPLARWIAAEGAAARPGALRVAWRGGRVVFDGRRGSG